MAKLYIMSRFGMISNEILRCKTLSLKAKGIYWYIQSKPDGWDFSAEKIAFESKDSRDSVRTWLIELENHWLLTREKKRADSGHWEIEYTLHEAINQDGKSVTVTRTENPTTENPTLEKPSSNKERDSKQDYSKQDKDYFRVSSKEDTTQALTLPTDPGIDDFQENIKSRVNQHSLIYKKWKYERERIKNLLTGKEYGKVCEDSNMDRKTFALAIIDLSSKLPFWNGKIYNAETLYKHYASVYNEGIRIKTEKQGKQEKFINYT